MSEDPTRAMERTGLQTPSHGSVGPADPHADPATDPGMRAVDGPVAEPRTESTPAPSPKSAPPGVTRTRTGGLWTGLILSAIVGIFLLVFILQNNNPVKIKFLGFSGSLPVGVALLLAAIAGLLLVAIPGGLRILQLRRIARRGAR